MKFKGYIYRKSSIIGFRHAQERDTYINGTQIESNYYVFVHIRDCPEEEYPWEEGDMPFLKGTTVRRVDKATKIIPITGHGLTNQAYGPLKITSDGRVYCQDFLAWDRDSYAHMRRQYIDNDNPYQQEKIRELKKKWLSNHKTKEE